MYLDRAGIAGEDGPTHHGMFDIAYLRTFPNIVLISPKDDAEMHLALEFALAHDGPVAIRGARENVPDYSDFSFDRNPLQLGKGEILVSGKDGAILAYGVMVFYALKARQYLKKFGIDVTVANARFAKPIDSELVNALIENHPFVLTVEDHSYQGGFGSAVLECAALNGFNISKLKLLAGPDTFIEHGSRFELLELLGLDEKGIMDVCKYLHENPSAGTEIFIGGKYVHKYAIIAQS